MPTSAPGGQPSAAVIVVNFNGAEFLGPCLESIAALDYPAELVETIVVDNASVDGSRQLLAERYPWVRVLPQAHNLGFAPAVNLAAASTDAECLALVNNDMRVEPGWLGGLVSEYDPDAGVICVGGVILSWDGEAIDFVEGFVNFSGIGDQPAFGRPVDEVDTTTPRDLLFACGSSMLISRDVFLGIGGFDESYFAYYEDVDLGWRLWLTGYDVRLAPQSRSFHLHQGTSSRFPEHQRLTLLERNALRTVIKNYDDRHLREVLGASLLLYMKRAAIRADLDRSAYEIGGDAAVDETVPRVALASLEAAAEVVEGLDDVLRRRSEVQAARKRSDAELIERFGGPLNPMVHESGYLEGHHRLARQFDEVFQRERACQLVVVPDDGDADRMDALADALGRIIKDVTVVRRETLSDEQGLARITDAAEVAVVSGLSLLRLPSLARTLAVLVVDLTGCESLNDIDQNTILDAGDFFVSPSAEEERRWTGLLEQRDRTPAPGGPVLIAVVTDPRSELSSLRDVVLEPWRWRIVRDRDRPYRAVTEDVRRLLDMRRDEVKVRDEELGRRLEIIERLNGQLGAHQRELADARVQTTALREEARDLRQSRDELLAVVEHQARRLDLVRRTPVFALYRLARRKLQSRAARPQ